MILVDHQITDELFSKNLKVVPRNAKLINPASLDVLLNSVFGRVVCDAPDGIIDPSDKATYHTENFEADEVILEPSECIIASTLERIELGEDTAAHYLGKSSLARLFIDSCSFGGWIDPGFSGFITLEIVNHSNWKIKLKKGMKIGQLVFFKSNYKAVRPYNKRVESKYKDQVAGQGSKFYENK